jgi:glyoxylase-like metal-dependent hydrolase (beta-lactamase superfamily II)
MKRGLTLGGLLVVAGLSFIVAAAQPQGRGQPAARIVEVEKLKDNLFVLRGGGGNTAAFITTTGVVLVDTKNPGWGQPLLEKVKTLTSKPVTMIINTHTHGDHVSGNVEFPATVEIVAHDNAKAGMQKQDLFRNNGAKNLPRRTFKDKMTLGSGPNQIDLYYFGRGHTDGDAWVVFPALRALHAGDMFARKGLPFFDGANGGSGVAIADTLQKAHDTIRAVDTIITGHSTQMTWADLREYIAFNREFVADIRKAKQAGKTVDEFVNGWKMPAKYAGYEPQTGRLKSNVQLVYDELNAGARTRSSR